jgi:hypothetical protein
MEEKARRTDCPKKYSEIMFRARCFASEWLKLAVMAVCKRRLMMESTEACKNEKKYQSYSSFKDVSDAPSNIHHDDHCPLLLPVTHLRY